MTIKKHKRKTTSTTLTIRISKAVKDALTEIAALDRRPLSQYLTLHLERHVQECTVNSEAHTQRNCFYESPVGTSEPPRHIKDLAKGKGKPLPVPVEKLTAIAESEEGWEGSDPRTLLAGTKVKI